MSFEQTTDQRAEQMAKAIDFAGKYTRSFDPELLSHLYRTIVEHTLPPNATLQEHAELNGQRRLILGIIRQYQLASTGSAETPWQKNQSVQHPQSQQPQQLQPQKQLRKKRS